jgi:hypothetical protein
MIPPIPRLVLHVGIHKTGTTTLQQSLESLRPQLRAHGVALVTIGQMKQLEHDLEWGAYRKGLDDPTGFYADFTALVGSEMAEVSAITGAPVEQVLVTSERMVGARMPSTVDHPRFRPLAERAIGQIIGVLDPGDVHVAIYTRRQDRLMESCYLWEIQKGRSHAIEDQFPFMFEPVLGFSGLIDRIASIERISSIRVRPFEMIGAGALAYLDDFLGNVGLSGGLDLSVFEGEPSANRSYSARALQVALGLNPYVTGEGPRLAVKQFLRRRFPVGEYPKAVILGDDARDRIIATYVPDNEQMFATWMPHLPYDAYSSTNATRVLAGALEPVGA